MNSSTPDNTEQGQLQSEKLHEVEKCLVTWAHARVEIEALGQQATLGADRALTLINRVLLGGTPSQILIDVPDQEVPSLLDALNAALKARNIHFKYEEATPLREHIPSTEQPSQWLLRSQLGSILEVWWFVQRASTRLMCSREPGAKHARQLVHHIIVLGEECADVVRTLEAVYASAVLDALDRAQTDYPRSSSERP